MRLGTAIASIALAASSLASSAQATSIMGSITLGAGALGTPTNELATDTSFAFTTHNGLNTANINLTSGDYDTAGNGLAALPFATTSSAAVTLGSSITLTFGTTGSFTGTEQAFTRGVTGGSEYLVLAYLGTFTPAGAFAANGFTPTATSLSIVLTQASPGASIGAGFSLNTPPVGVPEPASLAMAGLGLLGLAGVSLTSRRKQTLGV